MFEQDLIAGVRFLGFTSMFVLGILVMCINRGRIQSLVYNQSRTLIFLSSMLLASHALVVFLFHLRESNPALAGLISVSVFAPASIGFGLAELNLLRAGQKMRSIVITTVIILITMYLLCGVCYVTETLLDTVTLWKSVTFLMACCYIIALVILLVRETMDMRSVEAGQSDEDLSKKIQVLRYTYRSARLAMVGSLSVPILSILPSILVNSFMGIVMYGALIWYICSFMLYGQNMADVINVESEIIEADLQANPDSNDVIVGAQSAQQLLADDCSKHISADESLSEEIRQIAERVDLWLARKEYLNPRLNISHASKQIGIPLSSLNFYLTNVLKVDGYRQWIAALRIEAAKQLILEHQSYTVETISALCGFSDRSNFTRSFKAHEGVAPSIWLEKQKRSKIVQKPEK